MDFTFLWVYTFVLGTLALSYKEGYGVEKRLFIASLRAFFQLLALGYFLQFLFAVHNTKILVGIFFVMVFFAALNSSQNIFSKKRNFFLSFSAIGLSSLIVLLSLMAFDIIHLRAHEFIPLSGMIIGNALNVYTQSIERFRNDVVNTQDVIEGAIALGAPLKTALHESIRHAVKASLIPVINNLKSVGIVWIPGVATGMLLAGAEPLKAVSYQLVIMYMMVAISLLCAYLTIQFSYRFILSIKA